MNNNGKIFLFSLVWIISYELLVVNLSERLIFFSLVIIANIRKSFRLFSCLELQQLFLPSIHLFHTQ